MWPFIASWQQAENHCQSLDGHLVSFTKEKDLNDLVLHILNNVTYYWTGLRYVDNVWSFSDNADTSYAISILTQLRSRMKENCLLIKNIETSRPDHKTRPCTANHNFICQFLGNGFTSSMFSCSSKCVFLFIIIQFSFENNYRQENIHSDSLFIYLTSPTRAGSPQQLMPITVGPHYLTHPVNFPCGRKPEYPEKTHDFPQSVDLCSSHIRTGSENTAGIRTLDLRGERRVV